MGDVTTPVTSCAATSLAWVGTPHLQILRSTLLVNCAETSLASMGIPSQMLHPSPWKKTKNCNRLYQPAGIQHHCRRSSGAGFPRLHKARSSTSELEVHNRGRRTRN